MSDIVKVEYLNPTLLIAYVTDSKIIILFVFGNKTKFNFMIDKDYFDDYKLIGENIRKRRKKMGLTQAKLADKINGKIDHAKISDIEGAKEDFQFVTLLKICKGLELTLEELILYKE